MADLELLEELRKEIDLVDDAILDLLRKRMEIAEQIGQAKGGDPVLDPVREKKVLERLEGECPGIEPEYIRNIYGSIMALCRSVQPGEYVEKGDH